MLIITMVSTVPEHHKDAQVMMALQGNKCFLRTIAGGGKPSAPSPTQAKKAISES